MPRLPARSRNVVASDSEDDLALNPQPRRQTRPVNNNPKKTKNSISLNIQSSTVQDGEADDEDEINVLATQSPSTRNSRANGNTPKSRGVSARKSPVGGASQRKTAGKRRTPSKAQTMGSSSQAATQSDPDGSDSDLIVPGFPEGRRWLHSVQSMYQGGGLVCSAVFGQRISRPWFISLHLMMANLGFVWLTSVCLLVHGCSSRPHIIMGEGGWVAPRLPLLLVNR